MLFLYAHFKIKRSIKPVLVGMQHFCEDYFLQDLSLEGIDETSSYENVKKAYLSFLQNTPLNDIQHSHIRNAIQSNVHFFQVSDCERKLLIRKQWFIDQMATIIKPWSDLVQAGTYQDFCRMEKLRIFHEAFVLIEQHFTIFQQMSLNFQQVICEKIHEVLGCVNDPMVRRHVIWDIANRLLLQLE